MYIEDSYRKHISHFDALDTEEHFLTTLRMASPQKGEENVSWYFTKQLNESLLPLIKDDLAKKWLTIGDGRYGSDANFLQQHGVSAHASDITDTLLKVGHQKGFIQDFSAQNAESLSFEDNSFDYILCKDAFHHFPRPYIAFYEMLRVAREAIIFIEPIDNLVAMPLLIAAVNGVEKFNRIFKTHFRLYRKYSFEEVGNFVYKVSEREFNKAAMGIGLRYTAFKYMQYPYDIPVDWFKKPVGSPEFHRIKRNIAIKSLFTKLTLIPTNVLVSVIFKNVAPSPALINRLSEAKYKVEHLPLNPYTK